eukprot:gb/GECH01005692.1/.p1 GENE.gb/GECH01005692.1/~~gb/GECH01005692.1/.p1  ORF type:complete len:625 (+),score=133.86 gb/GECH01005692.1/:1-1875(+)
MKYFPVWNHLATIMIITLCLSSLVIPLSGESAPTDEEIRCQEFLHVRSMNGSCNNLDHPFWGTAFSPFRFGRAGHEFADNVSQPVVSHRPNARTVSNRLARFLLKPPSNHRKMTLLAPIFGQFVAHDLSAGATLSNEYHIVELEDPNDRFFSSPNPFFVRKSNGSIGSEEGVFHQINEITSYLDLSSVYGSSCEVSDALREGKNGRLKMASFRDLQFRTLGGTQGPSKLVRGSLNDILPTAEMTGLAPSSGLAANQSMVAGDHRAEENASLTIIHILFVREHNRIAQKIKEEHPSWSDEKLFQKTRSILIAKYQRILYHEWLPALLGSQHNKIRGYSGYNASVHPQLVTPFESAALRFGHSALTDNLTLFDECGNVDYSVGVNGSLLSASLPGFNPMLSILLLSGDINHIVRGLCYMKMDEIDVRVIDPLRNLFSVPIDLIATNLVRGRINGVPNYDRLRQAWRNPDAQEEDLHLNSVYSYPHCRSFGEEDAERNGTDSIECFDAITSNRSLAELLREMYGRVKHMDSFIGLLAEDHESGSSFGPTLGSIIARQFQYLRDGDRFYYLNEIHSHFTDREMKEIHSASLAKMIEDNFNVKIQNNVFFIPHNKYHLIPDECILKKKT